MHGATEEMKLHCLKFGSNPGLYEECILLKMRLVVLELVSLLSVAKMTSASLQKAPYKLENGPYMAGRKESSGTALTSAQHLR